MCESLDFAVFDLHAIGHASGLTWYSGFLESAPAASVDQVSGNVAPASKSSSVLFKRDRDLHMCDVTFTFNSFL